MSLKILSLNTRGLRDVLKRRAIFNYYRSRAEFICLQETHSNEKDMVIWKAEWGGDILFVHGTTQARGVCVLMPKGAEKEVKEVEQDKCGRIIKFKIKWNNELFSICNIYAPNKDSPAFFPSITTVIVIM